MPLPLCRHISAWLQLAPGTIAIQAYASRACAERLSRRGATTSYHWIRRTIITVCGTCKPNRSFDPDYKSNRTDWSTVDDGFGTAAAFDQYLDVAALLYITMKQTSTPTPILLDKCTAAQWDALLADGPYYASTSRRRDNEREAEKNRWKRCLHVHGDETIAALLEKRCLPESVAAAGGPKRPRGTGSGGGMGGGGSG